MGQRVLRVDPTFLVALLQQQGGAPRNFTVDSGALPDDAVVSGVAVGADAFTILITLESPGWPDAGPGLPLALPAPLATVHYQEQRRRPRSLGH